MSLPRQVLREDVPCRDGDPELFFPDPEMHGPQGARNRAEKAKRICLGCPVLTACLAYAMRHPQAGVWGATTETEREQIRRRRGRRAA